jgi:hypothetical protein
MSEIEDYGVTVEEYLFVLAAGIDILELRSMAIVPKVANGTATPEEICRSMLIMSPRGRQQLE